MSSPEPTPSPCACHVRHTCIQTAFNASLPSSTPSLLSCPLLPTITQSDQAGRGGAGGTNPCQAILWHRIVFDEGHTLRNAGAKLAKTANELAAQREWRA
mgnify:CR=1 FL=1